MATASMDYRIEERKVKEKAQRNLVFLATFSIVMLFGGLTSAYVVRHDGGAWFPLNLPSEFWISTILILFSSVTLIFSQWAYGSDRKALGNGMMALTLLLGTGFAFSQWYGWKALVASGVYLSPAEGQGALISGSFIYVLTGIHLAHLLGGLISLFITLMKGLMGKYSSTNIHGVKLTSIYWHFLDGLWIYLFLFLTIFK